MPQFNYIIRTKDGVREEGNTEERIQALENNFFIKNYLTKYTPGMGSKDSTGKEKRNSPQTSL